MIYRRGNARSCKIKKTVELNEREREEWINETTFASTAFYFQARKRFLGDSVGERKFRLSLTKLKIGYTSR